MKVWFDILTPKQVMFFKNAVDRLRSAGHEVLCTSRKYREAVELAKIRRLDLKLVGSHGGSDRYAKLRSSASRIFELAEVVDSFKPDVAITFSSPEGARVAYGLGIPHVVFNDSPHSEAVARLTIPLATRVFCPWVIPRSAWSRYGVRRGALQTYRALDPAAWLKHSRPEGGTPSGILVRLEESKASYIADSRLSTSKFVDQLVSSCHGMAEIAVLCRYEDQIQAIRERYGDKVRVISDVVDGTALLLSAKVFVGAGGTMTAEAALLGKPTISITPFSYYVEAYLRRAGLVKKASSPEALVRTLKMMLSDDSYSKAQAKKAARILSRMEDPTDRIFSAASSVGL